MNTSDSITKIASAYVSFTGNVGKIAKDADNPFHKNSYATLDQIVNEIRPILNEHKLAILQNVSGDNGNVTVKTLLLHESGEWMESDGTTLTPQKQDPQGAGGAVTYARRYDLCAFLSLNTGEDDDGNNTSGHNSQSNQNNSQNGSKASSKQLDYIKKLLNDKATEQYPYNSLYNVLKGRLETQEDMEKWTSNQASQAIKILQEKGS